MATCASSMRLRNESLDSNNLFPGPHTLVSGAPVIDPLDRRQCFAAMAPHSYFPGAEPLYSRGTAIHFPAHNHGILGYEPVFSGGPAIGRLDPNHKFHKLHNDCFGGPQQLISSTPNHRFQCPSHSFPGSPPLDCGAPTLYFLYSNNSFLGPNGSISCTPLGLLGHS